MVEREVALTVRVTDRPKKLKPLFCVSERGRDDGRVENVPNANHDQHTADSNGAVVEHLVEALPCVEVPRADGEVQDDHHNESHGEAKDTFPAHDLDRLHLVLLHDPLFQDELGGSEDLGASNQEHTDDGPNSQVWRSRLMRAFRVRGSAGCGLIVFRDGPSQTHDSDTEDDYEEGKPLVQPKMPLQEPDAEQANEENQRTSGHLVYTRCDEEQSDVHQGGSSNIAAGGQCEEQDLRPDQRDAFLIRVCRLQRVRNIPRIRLVRRRRIDALVRAGDRLVAGATGVGLI